MAKKKTKSEVIDAEFIASDNLSSQAVVTANAVTTNVPVPLPSEVYQDYEFSRSNMYDILKQGYLALERMNSIADSTQNSRDYRVVGELITALTGANEKLLDIHKKKKELQDQADDIKPKNISVDKAVFMTVTTAELLQLASDAEKSNT